MRKLSKKDKQFFIEHFGQWSKKKPKPESFQGDQYEYALLKMPCRGFIGRIIYKLTEIL